MSRTVSFPCPACGRKHIGEIIYNRQFTCNGQTIHFTDDWEPIMRYGPPSVDIEESARAYENALFKPDKTPKKRYWADRIGNILLTLTYYAIVYPVFLATLYWNMPEKSDARTAAASVISAMIILTAPSFHNKKEI